TALPESLGQLIRLQRLDVSNNALTVLPQSLTQIRHLKSLLLSNNQFLTLAPWLSQLPELVELSASANPLEPELAAACEEGIDTLNRYFQSKADALVTLNEAKLILVGEGEVGKSSLLAALCGEPWEEKRRTTHGIEIKQIKVTNPDIGAEI